ncbi:response regulator [Prolixibacteraceae bacterium JC049]|nr:response regulator [Prolixibacteraceae bacterium JC049]
MEKKKILVIEDDVAQNRTLQKVLERSGYNYLDAYTGAEGVQKAFSHRPDLILCDIKMTDIDGYQVLTILKNSEMTANIPFIFISGLTSTKDLRLGMEMGADDYIIKPYRNSDLIYSIQKRLERFESIKEKEEQEFEKFIHFSPNPIAVFIKKKIHFSNEAFRQLIQITPSEANNLDLEIILKDSFNPFLEKLNFCQKGIHPQSSFSLSMTDVKGNKIPVKIHLCQSKLFYNNTCVVALFNPTVDNSERNCFINEVAAIISQHEESLPESFLLKIKEVITQQGISKNGEEECNIKLSEREKDVLRLTLHGKPIKIIADELNISIKTVEKHRASLLRKTKSDNVVNLVIYSIRNNLISNN